MNMFSWTIQNEYKSSNLKVNNPVWWQNKLHVSGNIGDCQNPFLKSSSSTLI